MIITKHGPSSNTSNLLTIYYFKSKILESFSLTNESWGLFLLSLNVEEAANASDSCVALWDWPFRWRVWVLESDLSVIPVHLPVQELISLEYRQANVFWTANSFSLHSSFWPDLHLLICTVIFVSDSPALADQRWSSKWRERVIHSLPLFWRLLSWVTPHEGSVLDVINHTLNWLPSVYDPVQLNHNSGCGIF